MPESPKINGHAFDCECEICEELDEVTAETASDCIPKLKKKKKKKKKKKHPLLCGCLECSGDVPVPVPEKRRVKTNGHITECRCIACKEIIDAAKVTIVGGKHDQTGLGPNAHKILSRDEKEVGKHYNIVLHRRLTDEEITSRSIVIKLDPYRLAEHYTFSSSAMEHIFKKSIRNTTKGATEEKVLTEIIATAKRQLEILEERKLNL